MLRDFLNLLRKDDLQSQALQECHEMLDMCQTMVEASVDALRKRDDAQIDIDIEAMDKKLNAFERDVRRKVMTHLSMGNAGDTNSGLVLISIVIDLERIGDYTKNIHDLAQQYRGRLEGGALEDKLASIERHTLALFHGASAAFKASDENAARSLMREYKEDVSAACHELEYALVTAEVEMPAAQATALALYTRFLKRISAHSKNLVSSVVNPLDRIGYPE